MVKYLFTSDQRISELPKRIEYVSMYVQQHGNVSDIEDKSDNNNATTLKFYYNLHQGTEVCMKAQKDPLFAIRNFVNKFQFPNPRTNESLLSSIEDRVFLAPYRVVISLLYRMTELSNQRKSYLTITEILYFIFCNPSVYKNPIFEKDSLIKEILSFRENPLNTDRLLEEKINRCIEWKQWSRQANEMMSVLKYACSYFDVKKRAVYFSRSQEPNEEDDLFIKMVLSNNHIWFPSDINDFQLSQKEYSSYMDTQNTPYNVYEFNMKEKTELNLSSESHLQKIYYGAPGTGKSHEVNRLTEGKSVIRTTFHPDSDYSTFVGAYKPTMVEKETRVVPVVVNNGISLNQNNGSYIENQISYQFVKQAFTKAYLAAWKKMADYEGQEQFLIIEEINRGNCAQIFGDLFQLLDRQDNGFSSYPIDADNDLRRAIAKAFEEEEEYHLENDINVEGAVSNYTSNYGATLSKDVQQGRVLLLPPNLYIWATMNTSDQSLFPIDSAFKRRWDWQYVPIAKGYDKETRQEINWKIEANTQYYDWWSFLDAVNGEIAKATLSEDKKLGFFFCKADKGDTISAELFVSKVIFYLWNDVFKSETEDSIFKDKEGASITFDRFYKSSYGETTVDKELVEQFLENLKLEPIGQIGEDDDTTSDSPNAGQGQHKESIVAVTLNGERLSSDKYTQFDLYMEILKRLGISKVAPMIEQMKYRRYGCPMATTSPDRSKINGTGGFSYVEAEGYYFIKGVGSDTLIRILEDLKSEMNLDMIIESK